MPSESREARGAGLPARPSRPLIAATILATAALFARDAAGAYLIPDWAAFVLQVPALIAWCALQFRTSAPSSVPRTFDRGLTVVMLIAAIGMGIHSRTLDACFIVSTTFIAAMLLFEYLTALFHRLETRLRDSTRLLPILLPPWLLMILLGTVLLALPLATHSAVPNYRYNFWLHVSNSAFASISAGCLVGISSYSFGENFSFFGQAVILAMTQLSGMAFAAVGLAIARPFLRRPPSFRLVLTTALVVQLTATAILLPGWRESDAATVPQKFWFGLVHATSALWNSGWMLRTDGLGSYFDRPLVIATVTILASVGALGLPILLDLLSGLRPTKHKPQHHANSGYDQTPFHGDGEAPLRSTLHRLSDRPVPPWRRLAYWEATAAIFLILISAGCIFVWETPNTLPDALVPASPIDLGIHHGESSTGRVSIRDDLPHATRGTMSVFTAASSRSAGLQSMPLSEGAISWPTYALICTLMILGGSATGTAAGLRVSTILIILMCVLLPRLSWASHPGGYDARRMLLSGCLRVISVSLALCALAVLLLVLSTDGTAYERVFDAVSATSNVGFSTGLSLHLTATGRLSMMLMMIVGRWVPLILWLQMSSRMATTFNPPATADLRPGAR